MGEKTQTLSMSSKKVKGLLKGLRYISQIFENEKEQEIQIGCPTDVKHVAHIGWDGPSVNSPSWMNEFKTTQGFSSAPMTLTGDGQNKADDNPVKWISEDSKRQNSRSVNSQTQGRDLPELPRASRKQTNGSSIDSPTREKPRQRKSSSNKPSNLKESSDGSKQTQQQQLMSNDSEIQQLDGSEAPKKNRRKKSKDKENLSGGSSKLRVKAQKSSDSNLDYASPSSKPRNIPSSFEENENYERGMTRVS
ncbi:CRIB domain-containing protein RIC6 [Vicia villosa]|uniref:CRIB domain-containing protein RIC6 n=1 Tax=Vicia villosa TaxID=3911 RepID=UPI00273BA4C4|nr:CRIB domain-containing protein RIC6 [Vicia villosa]